MSQLLCVCVPVCVSAAAYKGEKRAYAVCVRVCVCQRESLEQGQKMRSSCTERAANKVAG